MNKLELETKIIEAWKPLFDAYPEITILPVYAWGRYYKYECAGNPFECHAGESLEDFECLHLRKYKSEINWGLFEKIDKLHGQYGGELFDGTWGGYDPGRSTFVKVYEFDSRGGNCLVIIKKDDTFIIECVNCDSPE